MGSNPILSSMLQFKYHYLLRIRENVFNSIRVVNFNRPKWDGFRKNFIFKLSQLFFFKKKKKYSLLFLQWLNIRYILSVYIKKRSYFRYTFFNTILKQLKYKLLYKVKNYLDFSTFYLKKLKNNTRSFFVSLFEMKLFIVLYRLGWFLKLNVSYYFFQLGVVIHNNQYVKNPYVILEYGDYLSVDYKFYNSIYLNLLNRTSFMILPYYNTFFKRRKRKVFARFNFNKRMLKFSRFSAGLMKTSIKMLIKKSIFFKRRYFYTNKVLKKSLFLKKLYIYNVYRYLYYYTQSQNFNFFQSNDIFYLLFNFCDQSINQYKSTYFLNKKNNLFNNISFTFRSSMMILFKIYLFQLKMNTQFYFLKKFFWFKKFFFVDRFLFMFPYYFVINFNTLELLVIDSIDSINYNKSSYFFKNLISDF